MAIKSLKLQNPLMMWEYRQPLSLNLILAASHKLLPRMRFIARNNRVHFAPMWATTIRGTSFSGIGKPLEEEWMWQ